MRALITGISGFTGKYLSADLTQSGYEVWGLTHAGGPCSERVLACELGDAEAVTAAIAEVQPDVVVHLAAIAFVAHGDVDAMYRTNVVGTRNLLAALAWQASQGHSLKSVLLASSANVYGNSAEGVLDEAVPPAPANDYAVSKLAMEYMARLWQDKLPITIVRPFNYTGLGQSRDFLIPKMVHHFRERLPVLELGNLDVDRDFSDVRMVVRAYRQLLEVKRLVPVGTYNICSGRGYALRDVLQLLEELAGFTPEIRVNPAFVRVNEVKRLIGSKTALEQAIGPLTVYTLRETLQWMLDGG